MEESTPPAKKQFPRFHQPARFYRTNLNGPLKITKADGTVEVKTGNDQRGVDCFSGSISKLRLSMCVKGHKDFLFKSAFFGKRCLLCVILVL